MPQPLWHMRTGFGWRLAIGKVTMPVEPLESLGRSAREVALRSKKLTGIKYDPIIFCEETGSVFFNAETLLIRSAKNTFLEPAQPVSVIRSDHRL